MSFSRLVEPLGVNPKGVNEIILALNNELRGIRSENPVTYLQRLFYDSLRSDKIVYRLLKTVREMIYGSIDSEPESDKTRDHLCQELIKTDLLRLLIDKLPTLDFDGKKDIALIFEYVIGQQIGTRFPTVEHIEQRPNIVESLVGYYAREEMVAICGQIIRECLRFESLTKLFFRLSDNNKLYINFLDYATNDSFYVCSDVFSTLHQLFCRHKTLAKRVLDEDYELFFPKLNQLLSSDNYYIRRKSVKLLSDLLYDRNHMKVMKKYVISTSNATTIVNLMNSQCSETRFQAFLVFSLFVCNPAKTPEVIELLISQKQTSINTINSMNESKSHSQYSKDMEKVVQTLNTLQ